MTTRDKKFTNSGVEPDDDIAAHKVYKDKAFYYEHAKLSAASYNPKYWEQETTKMGYDIDKSLSTREYTTYVRKRDNKAVISYKGTSPAEWKKFKSNDLAADIGLALGIPKYLNGRFRKADKVYGAVRSKYGARNVEVTGHSLGGSQAIYVGRLHNAKGIAFEPGAGPAEAVFRLKDDTAKKLSKTFRHAFKAGFPDPGKHTRVKVVASAFKPRGGWSDATYGIAGLYHLPGEEGRTWVKPRLKSPHDIKNFLY
jgi:hypothetical protein